MNSVISELQTKLNKGKTVEENNTESGTESDAIFVFDFKDKASIYTNKLNSTPKLGT